jgi:hypothetical protein
MPATPSNDQFLAAVFGPFAPDAHVTGFSDPPDAIDKDSRGRCWKGMRYKNSKLQPDHNNYFVISTFSALNENGRIRHVRRKAQFLLGHCVVVDDVGTKVTRDAAAKLPEPSWRLETSPGNEQWGYILDTPCDDGALFSGTLALMVAKGLSVDGNDPGMKGVTRYVRLPIGVNNKTKYGFGFVCKMQEWAPERHHSLAELLASFGGTEDEARALAEGIGGAGRVAAPEDDFRLKALDRAGLYRRPIGGKLGWHEIACPWLSNHSDGDDSGTAVFVKEDGSYGFKCHHGGCDGKHFDDVDTWLKAQNITGFDDVAVPDAPPQQDNNPGAAYIETEALDYALLDRLGSPPAREWAWEEWIGYGHVTSLYGVGGVGKSLLAMQISDAFAREETTALFGVPVNSGRVLGFFGEDDHNELWRRMRKLARGEPLARLQDRFTAVPRAGKDNVMIELTKTGRAQTTKVYDNVRRALDTDKYKCLVLDNVAQICAVPENDRSAVTQTVNFFTSLAVDYNIVVLLLGHPAKAEGSEYSGSTAWDAAVRARLLMERSKDGTETILRKAKVNYTSRDEMRLVFRDGYYMRADQVFSEIPDIELAEMGRKHRDVMIAAMLQLDRLHISVHHSVTSPSRYLPKVMIAEKLNDGLLLKVLDAEMKKMMTEGLLKVVPWRNASRRGAEELQLANKEIFE